MNLYRATMMTTARVSIAIVACLMVSQAMGQQRTLMPFVGETTAEYERRLGITNGPHAPEISAGRPGDASVTVHKDRNGHFFVEGAIDHVRVPMLVDTGASLVALSYRDAKAMGILPPPERFTQKVDTASGSLLVAPVMIRELRVGSIALRNVDALVLPRGSIDHSLLGMNFLGQVRAVSISDGQLLLRN